jgi:hypothetical protein
MRYWIKYYSPAGNMWVIHPVSPKDGFDDINKAFIARNARTSFTWIVVDHPDTIPLAPEKK